MDYEFWYKDWVGFVVSLMKMMIMDDDDLLCVGLVGVKNLVVGNLKLVETTK